MDQNVVPYGVSGKNECWVRLANGNVLAFESFGNNAAGTSYVRVLNPKGGEKAYWSATEWEEEPELVMGAICGAMHSTKEPDPTAETDDYYYQFAPDVKFPPDVKFKQYNT